MTPRRLPLVDLPPDQAQFPPATQTTPLPRNRCTVWLLRAPLVFIYGLLAFSFWAYFCSLVVSYLALTKHEWIRATFAGTVYLVLLAGSGGSCAMCVFRGAGSPLDKVKSEEASVGMHESESPLLGGSSASERLEGVMRKADGRDRYCRKCQCYKPDRTHHCSACRQCVLKMDQCAQVLLFHPSQEELTSRNSHCPWLGGGCVGWANYKFFLLFLGYTGVLGTFVAVSSFYELYRYVESDETMMAPIIWAIIALLGAIFGFALISFGLYHFYLACNNRTTIESMERSPLVTARASYELPRELRRKYERRMSKINIYDLGWKRNLADIFGGWESKWTWLLPIGWPPGDGRSFPVDRRKVEALKKIRRELERPQHAGSEDADESDF